MPSRRASPPVAPAPPAPSTPLRELESLLGKRFPDLKISLDEALDVRRGESVLDLLLGDRRIVVAWSPTRAFGVSSHSDSELGQRPDEVYRSTAAALERIEGLFLSRTKTSPPAAR